jgi:hypothetical protein
VVTSIRRELHQLERIEDWSGVLARAGHRPTVITDEDAARPIRPPAPMGWLERVNVVALGLIGVLGSNG